MQVSRSSSFFAKAAAVALGLAGLAATGAAQARDNVYWSVGVNAAPGVSVGVGNAAPVYVAPQPVYVAPQPVYVQPQPVYVQPTTIYSVPPVVYPAGAVVVGAPYYYRGHYYRGGHHHGHWR